MKALLLAAGLGTRLRPVTDTLPKCLVPIKGRPLLDYWLEMLTEAGVGPILLNLHYLPHRVQEYMETSRYRKNVELVYEEVLLGTGGTILANRDFFGADSSFLVIHADNYSLFDVRAFIEQHILRPPECEITMLTFSTDVPNSCGIVELDDRGVVVGFHEKVQNPPGNLANGAVYIFEKSIMDAIVNMNKSNIDISTEILPRYINAIWTYYNNNIHIDIGTLSNLTIAQTL